MYYGYRRRASGVRHYLSPLHLSISPFLPFCSGLTLNPSPGGRGTFHIPLIQYFSRLPFSPGRRGRGMRSLPFRGQGMRPNRFSPSLTLTLTLPTYLPSGNLAFLISVNITP